MSSSYPRFHSREFWEAPACIQDSVSREYFDRKKRELEELYEESARDPEGFLKRNGPFYGYL